MAFLAMTRKRINEIEGLYVDQFLKKIIRQSPEVIKSLALCKDELKDLPEVEELISLRQKMDQLERAILGFYTGGNGGK